MQVEKFLANQEGRQLYRRPRNRVASKAVIVTKPGSVWTADIKWLPKITYRGRLCKGIFVIIDNMSKCVFAYPLKGESYDEIKRCLELFFADFGASSSSLRICAVSLAKLRSCLSR
jgi:hypothetical protein